MNREYLYFVGCTSAYRGQSIAQSTVKLLDKLGISFFILKDENCCGSVLSRIGLVKDAKKLAHENYKLFKKKGVKKIITACAGCYNAFKNDYHRYLGRFDMKVNSVPELLNELIKKGKVNLNDYLKKNVNIKVTYHDPCHLGRHCGIYEEPREVIDSIKGVHLVEMKTNRSEALCCGAGGGFRSGFKDESLKVGKKRLEEAKVTGANYLLSSCPFCIAQFKAVQDESSPKIMDLTEFLLHLMAA